MELGFIGLGRMGLNMVRRLTRGGHRVVAWSPSGRHRGAVEESGGEYYDSLPALVNALAVPRVVWLMVPAGQAVDDSITVLQTLLVPGDLIVDGGNSFYRDSQRRGAQLADAGMHFADVGTSGGIWGLENGYCLMAGGTPETFSRLEPALQTLAQPDGYLHAGPVGAGHFVKMVHNGIEYGMLQAIGEGMEIMQMSEFDLDLQRVSHLWNHGSVVRSWLMELVERMYQQEDQQLSAIQDYVEDSGEGRWTVAEAIRMNIPAPVITLSLLARIQSRQDESYAAKVIAGLRKQFGGHAVKEKGTS